MDNPSESKSNIPAFFEVLVSASFGSVGVDRLTNYGYTSVSGWTCVACAIGSFFLGRSWTRIRSFPWLSDKFILSIDKVASDFRVWFAIIVFFWLYLLVGNTISRIENFRLGSTLRDSVQQLHGQMKQYVLPRHLTLQQQNLIGTYLSTFPSVTVSYEVAEGDREAGAYLGDIKLALMKAGWKIGSIKNTKDIEDGMRIDFLEGAKPPQTSIEIRQQMQKPDVILRQAFGIANVPLSGYSNSGVATFQEDVLTVRIGHRPMD